MVKIATEIRARQMETYVRQQKKTIGLRNQVREMKKQRKASTKAQEQVQLDTQIAMLEKELGKSSAAIHGIEKDPYKIMIKETIFKLRRYQVWAVF